MSIRPVKRLIRSKPTTEGAGVHLRRAGCQRRARVDHRRRLIDVEPDLVGDVLGFARARRNHRGHRLADEADGLPGQDGHPSGDELVPLEQRQQALQHRHRRRWAARNMQVDRDHLGNAADHRIAAGEAPSIPRTIPDCDDPLGIRDGVIGALQRLAHVLGHGAGHHQHIGMAR